MKILHYLNGLPPIRGGGLIEYVVDLATEQKKLGYDVELLVPGSYTRDSVMRIKKGKFLGLSCNFIENAIPVTMGRKFEEIELLSAQADVEAIETFYKKLDIDVLHVHSFMGLSMEFLSVAHELGIKIFYTTHDFYGLCPKGTLVKDGKHSFCDDWSCCSQCMDTTVSMKQMKKEQSHLYRVVKGSLIYRWGANSFLLKGIKNALRKENVRVYISKESPDNVEIHNADYCFMQDYYKKMFMYVDEFFFNSQQTEDIFKSFLGAIRGKKILLVKANIADNRVEKSFNRRTLQFAFLGTKQYEKGYFLLLDAMKMLREEGVEDFECQVFFNYYGPEKYIKQRKPYKSCDIRKVLKNVDVVIVPSIWKETYGFVMLEAISCGVPVIITQNVGAKELLKGKESIGIVVDEETESLCDSLRKVISDRTILSQMNANICQLDMRFDFQRHVQLILDEYKIG